ncbi:unnamed protein product [Prorocentrum cordatum]|uniref:50S ribosomal protein L19, chloroplastic n=1 Tax=Prorocentrum cordatum TaxID=2364126 RepID=A0ABN9RSR1_9DINO|nr:unnamed protein product [Polarella glacialis]
MLPTEVKEEVKSEDEGSKTAAASSSRKEASGGGGRGADPEAAGRRYKELADRVEGRCTIGKSAANQEHRRLLDHAARALARAQELRPQVLEEGHGGTATPDGSGAEMPSEPGKESSLSAPSSCTGRRRVEYPRQGALADAVTEDEGDDDGAASPVDSELQAESMEADAGTSSEARMAALRARAIQIKRDEDDAAEMERPAYAPLPGEDVEIDPRAVARFLADRPELLDEFVEAQPPAICWRLSDHGGGANYLGDSMSPASAIALSKAVYGYEVASAYFRTYHNVTADTFSRVEDEEAVELARCKELSDRVESRRAIGKSATNQEYRRLLDHAAHALARAQELRPQDEAGDGDTASPVDSELRAESKEVDVSASSEARMAALRARAIQIKRDEDVAAEEAEERPAHVLLPGEDVEIDARAVARYLADRRSSSSAGPGEERVYAHLEAMDPPESWFERRLVDRHKVNMRFFDMFAKPKSFFPHELKPGDTIRAFYMQPTLSDKPDGEIIPNIPWPLTSMKEIYIDGIILRFKGIYHGRTMTVRTMVGRSAEQMGVEVTIPIHSPLLTKIEVLRRGYIGRNKNAYFIRAMIGKKNVIPLDKERTEMDKLYQNLKDDRREDEIPEKEYPTAEWESYPLPTWWQDTELWDEANYDPDMFDDRSRYEKEVLGAHRQRIRPVIRTGETGGKKEKVGKR